MNELYKSVLHWHERGFATIPIRADTKTPAVLWREYQWRLPWRQSLEHWFSDGRYQAYGLILAHGLTVLDFDTFAGYAEWWGWAQKANPLAYTVAKNGYAVRTARGVHVYILQNVTTRTRGYHGFDLKAGPGAYVMGEGSQHPSGVTYTRFDCNGLIFPVERLEDVLPPWLQPKTAPTAPAPTVAMPANGEEDPWDCADPVEQKRRAKQVPAWAVLGVTPTPSGPGFGMACCPMHDDQTPSLSCDLVTGRVYCFAGCTGAHGWDAIDAYRWRYRVNFWTAVRMLA